MKADEIRYQAAKLDEFIERGGSERAWWRSKGFSKEDRKNIRLVRDVSLKCRGARTARELFGALIKETEHGNR